MRTVTPAEFKDEIIKSLVGIEADCVTGPGRSGAIAAVYASHILHIPFIPYGQDHPSKLSKILVIDTATESGKTLRRAAKKYPRSIVIAVYKEPPRVKFWYEADKPQRYKHEDGYFYKEVREPQIWAISQICDPLKW